MHYYTGLKQQGQSTRSSSVDEIGERYRLNYAIVVTLYHPYTQFHRNVHLSHRQIATFSAPLGRIVKKVKRQGQMNTHIIFESVLILLYQKL